MKKTQEQIVKEMLARCGFVTNFWAIENYILRLGAIIHELRKQGIDITSAYGSHVRGSSPKDKKNCYYMLTRYVTKHEDNTFSFHHD